NSGNTVPNAVTLWQGGTGVLLATVIGGTIFFRWQIQKLKKKIRFQHFKNQELEKKLKLALRTITKMETNPDLVHSREFNLEYLRMRMDEQGFNSAIRNQIKAKINTKIAASLRTNPSGPVGVASTSGRQILETIEVEYATDPRSDKKRVLFRIQVRLVKLPSQKTTEIVREICECMTAYLSPEAEEEFWQPTIQGHLATLQWDQKAKPTPMLVLEQTAEGKNVTLRSRMGPKKKYKYKSETESPAQV
ncbi:MAG: hypothetical protein ACO4AJ_16340, partial [Prochlorothrix sp.]